jgi:hypothetical protein
VSRRWRRSPQQSSSAAAISWQSGSATRNSNPSGARDCASRWRPSLFVTIAVVLRLRPPRGRELALTATYGIFSFTLSYALMYWALVRVTAGVDDRDPRRGPTRRSVARAAQRLESISRRSIVGSVVAHVGIIVDVGGTGRVDPSSRRPGGRAPRGGTIGQSVILGKRVSKNHPAMTNAVGLVVGAPLLLVISAWRRRIVGIAPADRGSLVGRLPRVLLGSGGLFVLMLLVVSTVDGVGNGIRLRALPGGDDGGGSVADRRSAHCPGDSGALIVMAAVWFGALAPAEPAARRRDRPSRSRRADCHIQYPSMRASTCSIVSSDPAPIACRRVSRR